ncbi:MAG: hypothetical protein QOG53_736 [Frankiales bacterium]|jgi:hypothetical protein|nr:hypothetical protein [Frankiales bacterium]
MSRHTAHNESTRRSRRLAVGAAFAGLGLAITGIGVYAGLTATASNTSAQTVSSGNISLTMAASTGSVGFGQSITNLAPGDVVNRFVTLTNGGSLAAKDLTLAVSDATPTLLSTSGTKGLKVAVDSCSIAWVVAANSGTCAGTTTNLLASTFLSSLSSAATLVSGTVGASYNVRMSLTLPDQNETTSNGTLPGTTIQGLSAALTWTFSESQRDATTTNN